MPKWTPYISGERAVVVGGDYIYCYALTHEESVKFAAAHNADIDALTAEVDELQRRLDAVVDRLPEGGVWCYACNRATVPVWGEEPYEHIPLEYGQMKTTFRCSICKRETYAKDSCVDSLRAIAEGRDNE